MTAFSLKLLLTPLLMLSISLAARRWGTHIGGLLSGLPVTSATVMLFLSLEQGPGFASKAVPGALAGVAAIQATYLFYFLVTSRIGALPACVSALAFYALMAVSVSALGSTTASIVIALCLVAAIHAVTSTRGAAELGHHVAMPRWIIPMRMLTATGLLLGITAIAQWAGPVVSGFLAPIPVIAWPLAVFAHVQGGRSELGAIVRGNAIGAVGVIGFYLTLKAMILPWGVYLTVGCGVALAVLLTMLLARLTSAK